MRVHLKLINESAFVETKRKLNIIRIIKQIFIISYIMRFLA